MVLSILLILALVYVALTLWLTYLVQQMPRKPVTDNPDWGTVQDTMIPTAEGGQLEVWRIEPDGPSRGIVLLAHGWGRNRDRMVHRARIFGDLGFTTVIHSARDHGGSTPQRFMNAVRFSEDIAAVLNWIGEPAILYGHSMGSAGAIVAAHRHSQNIKLLFLEASYARTKEALLSLYRWFNPFFGICFGPMIIFWMNLFYRNLLDTVSPIRLAPDLNMPVMLIHGANDRRFPVTFAHQLKASFQHEQVAMFIAPDTGHSESSRAPGYTEAVKTFLDKYLEN